MSQGTSPVMATLHPGKHSLGIWEPNIFSRMCIGNLRKTKSWCCSTSKDTARQLEAFLLSMHGLAHSPQPVCLQGSSNCTTLVHPEARNLPLLTWSCHVILEINFKIRSTNSQPDHSSVPLLRHLLLPNAS